MYKDTSKEGKPVSLVSLFRLDPDWAESRIKYTELEINQKI